MAFNLSEISGSLGDLGIFIPLTVSLITVCKMDGGSILLFAGILNIISGIVFNLPIPVQPMKAIAIVAISEGLMPGEIAASGFLAGLTVFIIGISGLVTWAQKLVPRAVVRGIQLGVGLKLAAKGISLVLTTSWWGLDSRVVAILAATLILSTNRFSRFPVALIIFLTGLLLLLFGHFEFISQITWGWEGPQIILPTLSNWSVGLIKGTIPQIPLTLLNSVIAVCALSSEYFPGRGIKVKSMAISVGMMNIFSCLFGGMPVCHGSGGLAGQYKFGARTGGSVVILGLMKICIALLFGGAAISILSSYPISILGVLLIFSGLELTLPARACVERDTFFVVATTAGGILAVNTGVGFILGIITAIFLSKWSFLKYISRKVEGQP